MTDNSGIWTRQLAVGLSGLAVLASATVVAAVHTADPASADTYVSAAVGAQVRGTDGATRPVVAGQRVPSGAQVLTGPGGSAELTSSGRTTYLGGQTTVDVLDGVRERLTRGQVMVDSRRGPRLSLGTSAGEVRVTAGSLSRVENATVLRLGVFAGSAGVTAAGRQTTTAVPALHQVQVPYGFLPGEVTPLALTDDRWETRLASALVTADEDLTHLAASLSGNDGVALLNAAPASLRAGLGQGPRGELALSAALAQAASGSPSENLPRVLSARTGGGSWGVVAALVDARVTSVSHLLDLALAPFAPTAPILQAAPPVLTIPGIVTPATSAKPARPVAPRVTPTRTTPTGTRKPTPTPTPTPTRTTDPGLVGGLVSTVLGLLTPPTAAAAAPVTPRTPAPPKLLGVLPLGH